MKRYGKQRSLRYLCITQFVQEAQYFLSGKSLPSLQKLQIILIYNFLDVFCESGFFFVCPMVKIHLLKYFPFHAPVLRQNDVMCS